MNEPRDLDERLSDWVDGRMPARERERFEAELRVNPRLLQAAQEFEQTVRAVQQALRQDPARVDLAERVLAALPQQAAVQPVRRVGFGGWLFGLGAAAALLLGFLLLQQWPPAAPVPLERQVADAPQGDFAEQRDRNAGEGDAGRFDRGAGKREPGKLATGETAAAEPADSKQLDGRAGAGGFPGAADKSTADLSAADKLPAGRLPDGNAAAGKAPAGDARPGNAPAEETPAPESLRQYKEGGSGGAKQGGEARGNADQRLAGANGATPGQQLQSEAETGAQQVREQLKGDGGKELPQPAAAPAPTAPVAQPEPGSEPGPAAAGPRTQPSTVPPPGAAKGPTGEPGGKPRLRGSGRAAPHATEPKGEGKPGDGDLGRLEQESAQPERKPVQGEQKNDHDAEPQPGRAANRREAGRGAADGNEGLEKKEGDAGPPAADPIAALQPAVQTLVLRRRPQPVSPAAAAPKPESAKKAAEPEARKDSDVQARGGERAGSDQVLWLRRLTASVTPGQPALSVFAQSGQLLDQQAWPQQLAAQLQELAPLSVQTLTLPPQPGEAAQWHDERAPQPPAARPQPQTGSDVYFAGAMAVDRAVPLQQALAGLAPEGWNAARVAVVEGPNDAVRQLIGRVAVFAREQSLDFQLRELPDAVVGQLQQQLQQQLQLQLLQRAGFGADEPAKPQPSDDEQAAGRAAVAAPDPAAPAPLRIVILFCEPPPR